MTTGTVRQADLADLEELAGLFDEYRQFQGKENDLPAAHAFLRARFELGESVVFIAHSGLEPTGFAQLYPSFSSVSLAPVFVLNDLFVRHGGRRCGIASMLLAAVEQHAWSLGAVRVTLNVAAANESAQALYAARGWVKDAQFFMYHRLPTSLPAKSPAE